MLQRPANAAPEAVDGPFENIEAAERSAADNPREGGYSVAQALTLPPKASA